MKLILILPNLPNQMALAAVKAEIPPINFSLLGSVMNLLDYQQPRLQLCLPQIMIKVNGTTLPKKKSELLMLKVVSKDDLNYFIAFFQILLPEKDFKKIVKLILPSEKLL